MLKYDFDSPKGISLFIYEDYLMVIGTFYYYILNYTMYTI